MRDVSVSVHLVLYGGGFHGYGSEALGAGRRVDHRTGSLGGGGGYTHTRITNRIKCVKKTKPKSTKSNSMKSACCDDVLRQTCCANQTI
jgi:hypothetical protein